MANIDKVSVKNTVYNIVSPAVVSDYIEVIGGACTKPGGYVEDEVILAKQNDVQLLFKATQTIAFGANIVENTNCVRTTLEEVLKNAGGGGGASSADQVSYDNSDSGLEAENVQEAVDELASKAGTASSQIQTLTNETYNVNDTAITEVASDDLLPIYDTSATGKKKIAVSNFIGGLVSNPNLLDNPWFTINQRGQSSYIGASVSKQYTFDRWYMSWADSDVSITKNNDGTVTYANTSNTGNRQCSQLFEEIPISDCDCTISIDVTAFSGSDIELFYTMTTSPYTTWIRCPVTKIGINSMTVKIPDLSALSASDVKLSLKIGANCSVTFKSIKFEKGKVSTLAQDTAPNYATELLKCQRYFKRIVIGERIGRVNNGGLTIRFGLDETENMRISPTATEVNDAQTGINISGVGVQFWLTKTTDYTVSANKTEGIFLNLTETGAAKLASYTNQIVGIWIYNQYLDLSADL